MNDNRAWLWLCSTLFLSVLLLKRKERRQLQGTDDGAKFLLVRLVAMSTSDEQDRRWQLLPSNRSEAVRGSGTARMRMQGSSSRVTEGGESSVEVSRARESFSSLPVAWKKD